MHLYIVNDLGQYTKTTTCTYQIFGTIQHFLKKKTGIILALNGKTGIVTGIMRAKKREG